jgi:hypothetical protein
MNKILFATAAALLMAVIPVSGTHMDGALVPNLPPLPNVPISDTDFVLANPLLILCESKGQNGLTVTLPIVGPVVLIPPGPNPDPVNPSPIAKPGIGGLCYSGQNSGAGPAGTPLDANQKILKKAKPVKTDLLRLDLCTVPTNHRPGLPAVAVATCAAGGGSTMIWDFDAQLGSFSCRVNGPQSFYYSKLYAWMTWDVAAEGGNEHVSAFPDLITSLPAMAAYLLTLIPGDPHTVLSALVGSAQVDVPPAGAGPLVACGGSDPVDGPTWVGPNGP